MLHCRLASLPGQSPLRYTAGVAVAIAVVVAAGIISLVQDSCMKSLFIACIAAVGLLLLALVAGCQKEARPTTDAQPSGVENPGSNVLTQAEGQRIERPAEKNSGTPPASNPPAAASFPPPPPLAQGKLIEETWDAYSIQGQRVGYACNRIVEVTEAGESLRLYSSHSLLALRRLGQSTLQRMSIESWEKPSGELVRFATRMTAGSGDVSTVGQVIGDRLKIETTTLGKSQQQSLPWDASYGGFFAADQSLRREPLKPGETRNISALLPLFNIVAEHQLTALDLETVKLPDEPRKLLKVQSKILIGKQAIDSLLWIDNEGETLKSLVLGIDQEAVRTTREQALLNLDGGELDLMLASIVKLNEPLNHPLTTRRAVYRATIKAGNIESLFASGLSQQVEPLGERVAEITVRAIRPAVPAKLDRPVVPPTPSDLAPNNMIQSDDATIVAMAKAVAPEETDPWRLACQLERFVQETIQSKNFSQAFATAAEVAQSREGDCTEHSVLLAALCRARNIPARVAFGLVYYPPQQGFAYHMWNEVWIKDRWVPLDGTLGLGGIGADHLKLADSDLKDSNALATMLPVVQLMGQLKLEVVESE